MDIDDAETLRILQGDQPLSEVDLAEIDQTGRTVPAHLDHNPVMWTGSG